MSEHEQRQAVAASLRQVATEERKHANTELAEAQRLEADGSSDAEWARGSHEAADRAATRAEERAGRAEHAEEDAEDEARAVERAIIDGAHMDDRRAKAAE